MTDPPERFVRSRAAGWLLGCIILPAFLVLSACVGLLGFLLEVLFGGWTS